MTYLIEYLGKFEFIFETILDYETGDQMGSFDAKKNRRQKISCLGTFKRLPNQICATPTTAYLAMTQYSREGVVAQLGRRGGSTGKAWWLNREGVVAQWEGVVAQLGRHGGSMGRRSGSIGKAWWLNWEGVVAQWEGVVAQLGRRGGSIGKAWWLIGKAWWLNGSTSDCSPAVPGSNPVFPGPQQTANLLEGCHLGWHLAEG